MGWDAAASSVLELVVLAEVEGAELRFDPDDLFFEPRFARRIFIFLGMKIPNASNNRYFAEQSGKERPSLEP